MAGRVSKEVKACIEKVNDFIVEQALLSDGPNPLMGRLVVFLDKAGFGVDKSRSVGWREGEFRPPRFGCNDRACCGCVSGFKQLGDTVIVALCSAHFFVLKFVTIPTPDGSVSLHWEIVKVGQFPVPGMRTFVQCEMRCSGLESCVCKRIQSLLNAHNYGAPVPNVALKGFGVEAISFMAGRNFCRSCRKM